MKPETAAKSAPIILFRHPKSGHCHRVELMMALLGLSYETVDLDMANGAHKKPDFLKISPFGQVPAINDNGAFFSDSNGIIFNLAIRYGDTPKWVGYDASEAAEIVRWLSVAAGEIASGPCSARLVTVFGAPLDHAQCIAKSHALFKIMDSQLQDKNFLVAERLTLADIACYSYVAHAPEGGVSLEPYPNIRNWLSGIEAQPNFVGMAKSPVVEPVLSA